MISHKLDGVVQLLCRPCHVASFGEAHTRRVMAELGVPVLTLEVDTADLRGWSDDRVRSQIDSFSELLQGAKTR